MRRTGETLAVFAGAFRRWHGAIHLVDAIRTLRCAASTDISAVMIGDGPELGRVRQAAASIEDGVRLTGVVEHDRMPACLAAADIGVAPFDVSAHAPLGLDFYWSPLKVFEHGQRPARRRSRHSASSSHRCGRARGPSVRATDPNGLVSALERLSDDVALRATLGAAARARAVREFGWDVHCRKLDEALRRCAS
jgi:glycosyltransferase involved in cell wall biosynthesis